MLATAKIDIQSFVLVAMQKVLMLKNSTFLIKIKSSKNEQKSVQIFDVRDVLRHNV